jgi:hypothetical protein
LPGGPDSSPREPEKVILPPDSRKENRMAEKKAPHRGTGKSLLEGMWEWAKQGNS